MWKCKYIAATLDEIAAKNKAIAERIDEQGGFVTEADIPVLAELNINLLVRCNATRFVCPAAVVDQRIEQYERTTDDYVRDVSIPVPMSVHTVDKRFCGA